MISVTLQSLLLLVSSVIHPKGAMTFMSSQAQSVIMIVIMICTSQYNLNKWLSQSLTKPQKDMKENV